MQKTLEQAQQEADEYLGRLPLPGDSLAFRLEQLNPFGRLKAQAPYGRGVLVEVRSPQTPSEKFFARVKTARRNVRLRLLRHLYRPLTPLYARCLLRPNPDDITEYRDKLRVCAEADRREHEAFMREIGERNADGYASGPEPESLEDEVRELWEGLLASCHDSYLFPMRSGVQKHTYIIRVSAEPEDGSSGVMYAEAFVDRAQAMKRLASDPWLVLLSGDRSPYWVVGDKLVSLQENKLWRVTDLVGTPLKVLESTLKPTVEVETGGGTPYPVLVLPIRLEPL